MGESSISPPLGTRSTLKTRKTLVSSLLLYVIGFYPTILQIELFTNTADFAINCFYIGNFGLITFVGQVSSFLQSYLSKEAGSLGSRFNTMAFHH